MRRLFLIMAVAAAGCGNGASLTELASDTCAELDGAIVLQAGPIVSRAIKDAEELGFTGTELGDAMREECPELMAAIENIGDEQDRRENLPNEMALEVTGCTDDGASGTVKNNSDVTVSLFIDVQYLDGAGTVVDDGIDSVSGLRSGETATWESQRFDDKDIQRCRADVDSAYED